MSGPRLSIIPAAACTDRRLKARDLQVLCVLGRHIDDNGWCRRSQVIMARELSCGRSTVVEAIGRLVAAEYVERHVVEHPNGRDSAHKYRVILDPPAVPEMEMEEDENVAQIPTESTATPVDIPTPPVGSGPTPPVGSGPTPMLTTPLNDPSLNQRERADEQAEEKLPQTGGSKVEEKPFLRAFNAYDDTFGSSRHQSWQEWCGLTEEDRDKAFRRIAPFKKGRKESGRTKLPAFSTYLRERWFDQVDDPPPVDPKEDKRGLLIPYGKEWGVVRLAVLRRDERRVSVAATTDIARWRQEFPFVDQLDTIATRIDPDRLPSSEVLDACVAVKVKSQEWTAWEQYHSAHDWPFVKLKETTEWVWFPSNLPENWKYFEPIDGYSLQEAG